jgi:hypothetical protein
VRGRLWRNIECFDAKNGEAVLMGARSAVLLESNLVDHVRGLLNDDGRQIEVGRKVGLISKNCT